MYKVPFRESQGLGGSKQDLLPGSIGPLDHFIEITDMIISHVR